MDIEQIETSLRERFAGGLVVYEQQIRGVVVRIEYGLNARGRNVFRYWFGDTRVDRSAWLTLTCHVEECPKRKSALDQWHLQMGELKTVRTKAPVPLPPGRLAHEHVVDHEGRLVFARQARLAVQLTCPHGAHPPLRTTAEAWDLFGLDGTFIGTVGKLPQLSDAQV